MFLDCHLINECSSLVASVECFFSTVYSSSKLKAHKPSFESNACCLFVVVVLLGFFFLVIIAIHLINDITFFQQASCSSLCSSSDLK